MNCSPRQLTVLVLTCIGLLQGCAEAPSATTPDIRKNLTMKFVPASDACFVYEGRFDFGNAEGPVAIWQGSRISFDFEGQSLALNFAAVTGENFFNLQLDNAPAIILAVRAGQKNHLEIPLPLNERRHRVKLFKRSEAAVGHAQFTGVEIGGRARTWTPAPTAYRVRMEFFGDSIMVGACNEDGTVDQWEDHRTHNNALSYTTLTADAFNADYRCIAVSGMGISVGYVPVKAGEVWNRLYPVMDAKLADLKAWQPGIAFINFGENDDSFSRSQQQPFPAGYTAGYVGLVKAMRQSYPQTHFVLLRGGMYGGSQSEPLRAAWDAAVREIEAADPAVSHYVFTHWSMNHPRVSDDQAMAQELIAWLKQQAFMKWFL